MPYVRSNHKNHYETILKPYFGLSSNVISQKTGLKQKHVQKLLKKYNFPRLKPGSDCRMEKNYFWKGGKIRDKGGYILVKNNQHPHANSQGYVREHRLVMEASLGRFLLPNEVVHHKNSKRDDNRLENLELFSSNGEHLKTELIGKIPVWSKEGKEAILQAVRLPRGHRATSNPME